MAVKINYKFTKERREGVARLLDTLAASCIIGASLGIVQRTAMSVTEIIGLTLLGLTLVTFSYFIRVEPK